MKKTAFAYKNKQEEVNRSSSGGAFIAICKSFEELYGCGNVFFFGAAFDSGLNVKHIGVATSEECSAFQGSKYVRSDLKNVFEEVVKRINQGKQILFSGTPCQIYAVKRYVSVKCGSTENLFTLDIICHGVPAVEIWNDYKKWLEHKFSSRMVEYSFRYKREGWKAYPAYVKFSNGRELINTADTSVFSKLHMDGYSISEGCFRCPFSKEERESDITLGDYWGIEHILPGVPYKSGISLVLPNSDDGMRVVKKMKGVLLQETEGKAYLKYQHNLNRPTEKPQDYSFFWKDYKTYGFLFTIQKYIGFNKKYKVIFYLKKMIRKTPIIELYRKCVKR